MAIKSKTILVDEGGQVIACERDFVRIIYRGVEMLGYILDIGSDYIMIGGKPELDAVSYMSGTIKLYLDDVTVVKRTIEMN